jgi:pimeloyl-ACP methyl ester carboxylesterase
MSRLLRLIWLLPLLSAGMTLAQIKPAFEPAPCPFNRPSGFSIQCGYITVPESRDPALADNSNTIRLAVAVFQGYSAQQNTTPLIYLDGGPGGRTLESVEYLAASFQRFMSARDVIFFDQRGVGFSQGLDCPAHSQLGYDLLDQDMEFAEMLRLSSEALLACRDQLVADGVNLAAYTSAESAADARDILTALGYERANLLGVSYGTRLALTIMRDHPEIVRSAILDAVLPLQANLYSEFPTNTQRAFDTLFEGCAQDPACNEQFPDLETVFYQTVDRLNAEPETVNAFDFYTGQRRIVLMNGDALVTGLFGLLYQTNEIPNLPGYIYEASTGEYDGFINNLFYTAYEGQYFDEGMFTTIGCNEEVPFDNLAAATRSVEGLPSQLAEIYVAQAKNEFELCAQWGGRMPDAIENEPVISDIPTLITVGEYDPITPPRWAQTAAETLSNSYLFEFRGTGHAAFFSSTCAPDLMATFVDNPFETLDARCVENVPPPLFATAQITAVENHAYESDVLGFRSIVPENWYEIEPGVLSPYPTLEPVAIPVIAFRFPLTLDEYISRIITEGFYAYDKLPPSLGTIEANGRDWQIYQVERPDENVYTSFAFFDGDRPYVIGVTATTAEERDYLYGALFVPAIQAFEITEIPGPPFE